MFNSEPIVRFGLDGRTSILSNNVPDPTSYSGRSYIDLQIPAGYFVEPSDDRGIVPSVSAQLPPKSEDLEAIKVRFRAEGTELSSELTELEPGEVTTMEEVGKRLSIYRRLDGMMTYKYVDADVANDPTLPPSSSGTTDSAEGEPAKEGDDNHG